jgi:hypothetical protein
MAKLIHGETKQPRELLKAVTLVGRAEYCDVCVPKPMVAREHARIVRRLFGYYVEDLGSATGTRVNNLRVHRRAKLHDGDVITIGMATPPGGGDGSPKGMPSAQGQVPRGRKERRPLPPASPLAPRPSSFGPLQGAASGGAGAGGGEPVVGATFIFRK